MHLINIARVRNKKNYSKQNKYYFYTRFFIFFKLFVVFNIPRSIKNIMENSKFMIIA